jgi:hypothetical protein
MKDPSPGIKHPGSATLKKSTGIKNSEIDEDIDNGSIP